MGRFDLDQFLEDVIAANTEERAASAVKEVVERAVSDPAAIEAALGHPSESALFTTLHNTDDLTVLHIVWPPDVDLFAHDHKMWAVIGLYGGREDNSFYRPTDDGWITPAGGKSLLAQDTVMLGSETVHSVANPSREWTGAFHVYGGDFFTAERTMWRADTLEAVPFDVRFTESVLERAAAAARAR